MEKIANRVIAIRKKLSMTQAAFAERIGSTRGYISQIEAGVKQPGKAFLAKLDTLDRSINATKVAEQSLPHAIEPNVDPEILAIREIPVYTEIEAGQATDFQGMPTSWGHRIGYRGNDEKAFALRVHGASMEPKFPEGTIITVSPKHPPRNGQHVAARLNGEGVFFKIFHHSGDNKTVTLTSYNPAFPPMVYNRERFDWIYPVTDATQKLL